MITQPISDPAAAATPLPGVNADSQGFVAAAGLAAVSGAASPAVEAPGIESSSTSTSTAMPPLEYEIITVPAIGEPERDKLRQQCYDVRIAVFSVEQGFPIETEIDDLDETATHLLLRLLPSLEPIGTIRGTYHAPEGKIPYYKLSRLVVVDKYRAYKLGRALVLALHAWIIKDSATKGLLPGDSVRVVCHSQLYVKGFYAKFGYQPEGEEFDEDGAPHQKMVANLRLQRQ